MSNKIKEKKEQLRKASEDFEDMLNEDITVISDTAKSWGGRLLLIGGVFMLSYLGVRAIIGSKRHTKEEVEYEPRPIRNEARAILIKSLSDKAALVLLELFREYLQKLLRDSATRHG